MQVNDRQGKGKYSLKQCFSLLPVAFYTVIAFSLSALSCTKPVTEPIIRVDTPPVGPSGPTGVIQEFSIKDTLIGYNRQTNIKWYVTSTNSLTEVTLNGIKVSFSGAIQSGPLTQPTTFTLMINNNVQQSKTVQVAGEIATILWNDGKRWITTGTRTEDTTILRDITGADSIGRIWKSTFTDASKDYYRDFRTSFFLDGGSLEEQGSTLFPKPKPSGKFTVVGPAQSGTGYAMLWKSRFYMIDTLSLSTKEMVLRVDTLKNGVQTYNRIRFTPEF